MTTRSGAMAWRLSAVSISVSPFSRAEPEVEKLMLSADSRFSAISKLERVRVEASKKRLSTVLPRSVGTFLIGRSPISLNDSAVSRISSISAGEKLGDPQEVLARPADGGLRRHGRRGVAALQDAHLLGAVGRVEGDLDDLALRRSGPSCPRSRPGSAARGGRGRSARRAARLRGRPKSISSSSAARTVRPV